MITNSDISVSVKIHHPELVNIYDSKIRKNTKIASFVEIGKSHIGCDCKIQAHSFICPNTYIEDRVFVGPGVRFCNVKYPHPMKDVDPKDFNGPYVMSDVVIGAGSIILPGVTIGSHCFIGAGSVVTNNCRPYGLYYGNPVQYIGKVYQHLPGWGEEDE